MCGKRLLVRMDEPWTLSPGIVAPCPLGCAAEAEDTQPPTGWSDRQPRAVTVPSRLLFQCVSNVCRHTSQDRQLHGLPHHPDCSMSHSLHGTPLDGLFRAATAPSVVVCTQPDACFCWIQSVLRPVQSACCLSKPGGRGLLPRRRFQSRLEPEILPALWTQGQQAKHNPLFWIIWVLSSRVGLGSHQMRFWVGP